MFVAGKRIGSTIGEINRITISSGAITKVASIDGEPYAMAADISSSTPLPVQLINWDARAGDARTALLKWETAAETPGGHFIVERAADGRSFVKLSSVKGKGSGKYSFTDSNHWMASTITAWHR